VNAEGRAGTIGGMSAFARFAVVLSAATLAACYESAVPLDPTPQVDIDPGVAGAWRCLPPRPGPTDDPANLTVTRARDRVYAVTFDGDGGEPDRYEAHASLVKGGPVVNVRDLSPGDSRPWTFMRYTLLRPDILEVRIAAEDALKGVEPTPAALRKRIETLDGTPSLFTVYCVCVRQEKE
jgi:hypothetical protein